MKKNFMIGIGVLFGLALLSVIFASLLSVGYKDFGTELAVIEINGQLMTAQSSGLFAESYAVSSDIIKLIDEAEESGADAYLFVINSPGGSPIASKDIGDRIKKLNKTTVAYIREVGASGGYWIASACDTIVAEEMSITGSIGVLSGYLEFTGLMDKYGVKYNRLVAGDLKDMGTPYREMTSVERDKFESKLDIIHQYFIQEVSSNRGVEYSEIEKLATGEFYLGVEALNLGLVDYNGNKDFAIDLIEKSLGDVYLVEYKREVGLFESFSQAMNEKSFWIGNGIGKAFLNLNYEFPQIL